MKDIFYIWSATFDISAESNQTARAIQWSECIFHTLSADDSFAIQKGKKVG